MYAFSTAMRQNTSMIDGGRAAMHSHAISHEHRLQSSGLETPGVCRLSHAAFEHDALTLCGYSQRKKLHLKLQTGM